MILPPIIVKSPIRIQQGRPCTVVGADCDCTPCAHLWRISVYTKERGCEFVEQVNRAQTRKKGKDDEVGREG